MTGRNITAVSRRGFTLIEMMTAIGVLIIMTVILVGISNQAGKLWIQGENDIQNRQRVRAALDVMGRELRQATLSRSGGVNNLQFLINPPATGTFANRDNIFWQAPISTDGSGGVAEVGYFVRWNGASASLCRYFVNPSDANYQIYNSAGNWVTSALLDAAAPATKASHYQGIFLENVIGLWVTPFQSNGTPYSTNTYNSANSYGSLPANRLPAAVEISLVMLDKSSAQRLQAKGDAASVTGLYQTTDSAVAFVTSLPPIIRSGASVSTIKVNLDNYRQ
jgi:Tfp pilus assembly protein PilW